MPVATGALVLADLSGYTAYLGGVELEHGHDILADLLGTVAAHLDVAGFRLAKLEGDCVFSAGDVGDVELRTAIETTYCAFRARRRAISARTTCQCDACRRIDELDLKFVAHRGEWIEHEVAGQRELVGPDVIVVHRLLKNDVDGTRAYALLTDAAGEHVEVVDGREVRAEVVDLHSRWEAIEAQRPVLVAPEDAWLSFELDLPAPPSIVFELATSLEHQRRWRRGISGLTADDPSGARGVGSTVHCMHGRLVADEEIVDWRPGERYGFRDRSPFGTTMWSMVLTPAGDQGTHLSIRVAKGRGRRERLLLPVVGRVFAARVADDMDSFAEYVRSSTGTP